MAATLNEQHTTRKQGITEGQQPSIMHKIRHKCNHYWRPSALTKMLA
ncbi:hypothetical protein A2U01_0097607, partial [Trifolium medium]|nr:hypothetical protein [Trifolium medium]